MKTLCKISTEKSMRKILLRNVTWIKEITLKWSLNVNTGIM